MTSKKNPSLLDGFFGDRRARAANYFQLDIGAPNRNFINIWLPETVTCDSKSPFFIPRGEDSVAWTNTDSGGVRCQRAISPSIQMESSIEEVEYGVELKISLSNISGETLKDVNAQTCVQFAAAPDLRDFGLERTFWRNKAA